MNKINQDSTIVITTEQVKVANLIFVEHQKLSVENELLSEQILNYKQEIELTAIQDSIRILELDNYKESLKNCSVQTQELRGELAKKDKQLLIWKIGGITVSVGMLIGLLLK